MRPDCTRILTSCAVWIRVQYGRVVLFLFGNLG